MKVQKIGSGKRVLISVIPFFFLLFFGSIVHGQWNTVDLPSVSASWNLSGVHFTSSSEGWAVGGDSTNKRGVLLHYFGGAWASVTPPSVSTNWWLQGVYFTSPAEGWAMGTNSNSSNFGAALLQHSAGTWTSVNSPPVGGNWQPYGIHFTSAGEGWIVGIDRTNKKGVLLHYSGGAWTKVAPPSPSADWGLDDVFFTSPGEGWAVGYDNTNKKGVLLHYTDGAWTWVVPPCVSPSWSLVSLYFTSSSEGWAVGGDSTNKRGVLLHYFGGAWTPVSPPSVSANWSLASVGFISPDEGWAVGYDTGDPQNYTEHGVLLHYFGGAWTSVTPPSVSTTWALYKVHFIPSGEGWAVGVDGIGNKSLLLHLAPPTVWAGTVSFSNKITSLSTDASEDKKFQSSTNPFTGAVEMYARENELIPNGEGCYIKSKSDDGSAICIKHVASLSTNVQKSKSDQLLLMGTGDLTVPIEGTPETGIIYLDAKGTLKKNSSGEVTSIILSGKIGGGSEGSFISGATFKTTLTPK